MRKLLALLAILGWLQGFSSVNQGMCATSVAIGGGALLVGASASTTVTVPGAAVGMNCEATTVDGTDMFAVGAIPVCTVTGANTVTVRVVALVALTPVSKAYNIRVK
jgi:hypothetical protein